MAEKKYYGIYQGIVTSHKDPENRGRLKVLCPDVLGGKTESAWCDPCIPIAYDKGGDFCIPVKDEAVWLMFIGGDANRPVWLGGWWQKNMTPLGTNYSDIDKMRIINYADCTITMRNGKININVGAGDYDLNIENGKVSVKGNLEVSGNVTVTGDVSANNVKATSQVSGSTVKATTGNITTVNSTTVKTTNVTATGTVKGESVEATTGNLTTLESTTINASGKLSADGGITTSDVTTDSLKVGGVSYSAHTHSGVTKGSDNTGKPN